MELCVWVDGAPRVVCGVTVDTTCQDVVIALAQAIGQTGRFALMEAWQDVERPLAPKERPLDVISRRGLWAGESSFILRRTGLQIDPGSSAAWFDHAAGEIVGHPRQRRSLPTQALISKAEKEARHQGEVVRRLRCRAQTLTGVPIFLQALSSTTSGCRTLALEEKLVGQKSPCNLGCTEERTGQDKAKNCDLRHAKKEIAATPLYWNEKIKNNATKMVEGCVRTQNQESDEVEKSLLVLEQEQEMFDNYKNTSFRSFYYQNCKHYAEPEKDAMDLNMEDVEIKWIQDTKCISLRDDVNFFETIASIGKDSLESYKKPELKSGIILKMKRVCGLGSVPQNLGKMKIGVSEVIEEEQNDKNCNTENTKGDEEERELKRLVDLEEEEDFWHKELLMEERRGEGLGARLLALRTGLNACETKLLASEEQLLSLMKCVQHAQVIEGMEVEGRYKLHDRGCFEEKHTLPAANHQGSTSCVCMDGDGLSTFPESEELYHLDQQRVPPSPLPNEHPKSSKSNSYCTSPLPLSLSMTDRWPSAFGGLSLLKEDLLPLSTSETGPVLGTEEKQNNEDASAGCDRLLPLYLSENNLITPLDGQCRIDSREQILAYWNENKRMHGEEESDAICVEEKIKESSEKEEGRILRRQLADALNEATRLDQEHQKVDGALLHAAHIAKVTTMVNLSLFNTAICITCLSSVDILLGKFGLFNHKLPIISHDDEVEGTITNCNLILLVHPLPMEATGKVMLLSYLGYIDYSRSRLGPVSMWWTR
uniref:uncharacterized protein isoform X2 n=1 Tax=Myxine glutinosa TaxID=7769 RepID=UPI00358DE1C6